MLYNSDQPVIKYFVIYLMYDFLSKLLGLMSAEILSVLFKLIFPATSPQSGTSQVLNNRVSVTKM